MALARRLRRRAADCADGPFQPPSEKIRVLIVDDHAIVRRGLRGLLEIVADMEVVGDAADGEQGVRLAGAHAPDVILMDLVMPVMDGIEAIRVIKAAASSDRDRGADELHR